MNQTFSGFVLLGIVVLVTAILFAIAYFKAPKQDLGSKRHKGLNKKTTGKGFMKKNTSKGVAMFKSKKGAFSAPPNTQLSALKKRVGKHFPEFTATLRQNYLVLERASEKVAMLTIDKAVAVGRRRLGGVTVINFHELPSVEELRIELSGV